MFSWSTARLRPRLVDLGVEDELTSASLVILRSIEETSDCLRALALR